MKQLGRQGGHQDAALVLLTILSGHNHQATIFLDLGDGFVQEDGARVEAMVEAVHEGPSAALNAEHARVPVGLDPPLVIHTVTLHELLRQLHVKLGHQLEQVHEVLEVPGCPHLHPGAIAGVDCVNATSNPVSGLQHEHTPPLLLQLVSQCEAREAGAEDDDV